MTLPFPELGTPAWDERTQLALDDLRSLLRFDTTNPPGNEAPAIDWIAQRLASAGIQSQRLDCDGRANLVARIRGTGKGGGPLLLAGHVDVVPAERAHWTADPFGAEIRDGYLFGRGTVDMKNMVVMSMHAAMLAQAAANAGILPDRDLIFAAVADEEEGCQHGSRFLVEEHPDLVRADYMIGEIGGFSLDINGVRYYPIQVAEKGLCRLRLTASGEPGHGSIPHDRNAVVRLADAIRKLGETRLPFHVCNAVRENIRAIAASQRPPASLVLPLVLRPATAGVVLDRVLPDRSLANTLAANLANTVTPTILKAGVRINVIPGTATAELDGRIVPGQTADDLVREVRAVIGDAIAIEVGEFFPGREDTTDDPLFRAICENVRRHDPTGVPIPSMIPGFTDAQYFHRLGARCYGYSPLRYPASDNLAFSKLFHGHDERIHVDGFRWGVGALWDVVSRFLGIRGG